MLQIRHRFLIPILILFLFAFSVSAVAITGCSQTFANNTYYTLDMLISTYDTCLRIPNDYHDITIDGGANCHITFGAGGIYPTGILVGQNTSNITIQDCFIEAPAAAEIGTRGIDIGDSNNVTIRNVNITVYSTAGGRGIECTSTPNTLFDQVNIEMHSPNSYGFYIAYAYNNNITSSSSKALGLTSGASYDLYLKDEGDIWRPGGVNSTGYFSNNVFGSSTLEGASDNDAIHIWNSHYAYFVNTTVAKKNARNKFVFLQDVSFITFENTVVLRSGNSGTPFWLVDFNPLGGSYNNLFQNVTVVTDTATTPFLYQRVGSFHNPFYNVNLTTSTNSTVFSASEMDALYSANIYINSSEMTGLVPTGYVNMGKFLNYTQSYPQQGGKIKIYFTEAELLALDVNISSIRMFKFNSTYGIYSWRDYDFYNASYYGVNKVDHYAYADVNVTEDAPQFAIFGKQPYVPATSCANVNGLYYLMTSDINEIMSTDEACFNVINDNVVFDCQGFNAVANGKGYFLRTNGHTGITVKNCNVSNWEVGVLNDGGAATVLDSKFSNFPIGLSPYTGSGIFFTSLGNGTVQNTTISDAEKYGVMLSSVANNTLFNSTISNTEGNAAYLFNTKANVSYNTFLTSGTGVGVYDYSDVAGAVIHNNYFSVSGSGTGVYASAGVSAVTSGNTIDISGSGLGANINGGNFSYNAISGSTANEGILSGGSGSMIDYNDVLLTSGTAMLCAASSSSEYTGNYLRTDDAADYALFIQSTSNNDFYSNTLNNTHGSGWEYISSGTITNTNLYDTVVGDPIYSNVSQFRTDGGFELRGWNTLAPAHSGYYDFGEYLYVNQVDSLGTFHWVSPVTKSDLQTNRVYGWRRHQPWMYKSAAWTDTGFYVVKGSDYSTQTWMLVTNATNALLAVQGKQDCGEMDDSFQLQANISSSESTCMTLENGAPNTRLDCNNYYISKTAYTGGAAVDVNAVASSIIRRCFIDGWSYGIYGVALSSSGTISVADNTIYSETPMYLTGFGAVSSTRNKYYANATTSNIVAVDGELSFFDDYISCLRGACNYGFRMNYNGVTSGASSIDTVRIYNAIVGASLYGNGVSFTNNILNETGDFGTPLVLYKNSAGAYFNGGVVSGNKFYNYVTTPLYGQLYIQGAYGNAINSNEFYGDKSSSIRDFQGYSNLLQSNLDYSNSSFYKIVASQSSSASKDVFLYYLLNYTSVSDGVSATNVTAYSLASSTQDWRLTDMFGTTPHADKPGYSNISKYFKWENTTDSGGATVRVYYADSDWNTRGINVESTLKLFYWDGLTWSLVPIQSTQINMNYVQGELSRKIGGELLIMGQIGGSASSCGDLSVSTTLNGNVQSDGTCFNITADNVVLDCNNYWINFSRTISGDGVKADNQNNVTVKNCVMYQLNPLTPAEGVNFTNVNNSFILNNTPVISGTSASYGIAIFGGDNNTIEFNNATTNDHCYHVIQGKFNRVLNNTGNSHQDGLYAEDTSNTTINYNDFTTNIGVAMNLKSNSGVSENNTISYNNFTSTTGIAVAVAVSRFDLFESNIVVAGSDGFQIVYSNSSRFLNTRVTSVSTVLSISNSNNNYFENTTLYTSIGDGLRVWSNSNANVFVNTNIAAGNYGVNFFSSSHNRFTTTHITNPFSTHLYAEIIGTGAGGVNSFNNTFSNLTSNASGSDFKADVNGLNYLLQTWSGVVVEPFGYTSIGKHFNASGSAGSWMFINVSYTDAEWQSKNINPESTMQIWNDQPPWRNSGFYASQGNNTVSNYVYANITDFSSPEFDVFGYFGCGNVNASITLTGDVSAPGTCFNVTADDVSIFCNNYAVNYSSLYQGYGVVSNGHPFVLDKCFIYQTNASLSASHGVYIENAQYSNLTKDYIFTNGAGSYGVFLDNANHSKVLACNTTTSGYLGHGVALRDSAFVTVWLSNLRSVAQEADGVYFYPTSLNNSYGLFDRNNIFVGGEDSYGFVISANANYSNFTGNFIVTTPIFGHGLYIGSDHILASGNDIQTSGGYAHAINVRGVTDLLLTGNILNVSSSSSGGTPIFLQGTTNSNVSYNNVTSAIGGGSNHYGVYASGTSAVSFTGNRVTLNSLTTTDAAVSFVSSVGLSFDNNTVVSQVRGDAFKVSSSTVSASGNNITSTRADNVLSFTSSDVNGSNNYLQDYIDSSYNVTFYSWNASVNTNLALKKLGLAYTPIPPLGYLKISRHLPTFLKSTANDSFLEIRMSYLDDELPAGANESEVTMMKLVGGVYSLIPGAVSDPTNNFVYANLSNFMIGTDELYLLVVPGYELPTVQLISPFDGYVSPYRNVNFVCNASAFGNFDLQNMTLYGNWSGSFIANDTVALTGRQDDASFAEVMPPFVITQQDYLWNCYACDTYGNCAFAPANWTFSVSSSAIANLTAHTTVGGFCDMTIDKTSIAFGALNDGDNTGGVNQIINITNSGNMPGNLSIRASRFENSTHSFAPTNMLFNTLAFTYPGGTVIQLTDTPIVNNAMPFLNTSLYLGLGIPLYQQSGDYQSNTTITLIC